MKYLNMDQVRDTLANRQECIMLAAVKGSKEAKLVCHLVQELHDDKDNPDKQTALQQALEFYDASVLAKAAGGF